MNDPAPPAFHFSAPMPYPAVQSMFDELIPKGYQWYWRGDFFDSISDSSIDVHHKYGENLPTPLSLMHLYPVDAAAHQVGPDDTAWAYRDAVWSAVIAGVDPDPANADVIRDWAVAYQTDLHPYSMGGSYINFIGEGRGRTASGTPTAGTTTGSPPSSGRTTRTISSAPTRTSPRPPEQPTVPLHAPRRRPGRVDGRARVPLKRPVPSGR